MTELFQKQRPHRASGEVAYHVLEIMHGLLRSAETRAEVTIDSRPERPEPLSAAPLPSRTPALENAHD